MNELRILGIVQGHYGERMLECWRKYGPSHWKVEGLKIKGPLPFELEDVSPYIPQEIPESDLIISLGEEPGVLELLPEIVKRAKGKAVIVPVDNRGWVPPGLFKQVEKMLKKMGISAISPVPFCSLKESDSDNPYIKEFARHFGLPEVRLQVDRERIKGGEVIRSAPCGSTFFVIENLKRERVQDAEERAGLLHHNYPCLATMTVDWQFQDTLMHRAGFFTKEAIKKALEGLVKDKEV